MPKGSSFDDLAREAAERLERARALGEQLVLLPDERHGRAAEGEARPVRGKGRAMSQMREWLAAQGYRLPEQVLAELAGLTSPVPVVEGVMAEVERVLAWAYDGAEIPQGGLKRPSAARRLELFESLMAIRLRAADALMPYGAPKAAPDGPPVQVNPIVVVGAPSQVAASAVPPAIEGHAQPVPRGRIAPPPMPGEFVENQRLADGPRGQSDGGIRTDEASH